MSLKNIPFMLDDGAYFPVTGYPTDAGYDLITPIEVHIPAHSEVTIDTGVHFLIPAGYYGGMASKSGLMCRHHVITVGGIIDCNYTGSVKVQLRNNGDNEYIFKKGEKITQIIFHQFEKPVLIHVTEFPTTDRGDNGFGSTGK